MRRSATFAIICAALAVMMSTGIRQSFGLFLEPMAESFNLGRGNVSLAGAISNLIYGLPLVGILADRYGSRWILLGGGLLYALGLFMMTQVQTTLGLIGTMGIMVGLALGATTYVVVLGAVAQLVPPEKRSRSFGIITAAGSSGMFVVPPVAQVLIGRFGWQQTVIVLAGFALLIVLLALGLPGRPAKSDPFAAHSQEEPFIKMLNRARKHRGYLLLISGFFVCGFHVAFIGFHLPAFLSDNDLPQLGGVALSLTGVFNIVGSSLFGWLGDYYRKKYLLSLIYFGRAVVIALFIIFPITQTSALLFAGAIGFLWLATVPLTSGTVAQIFGSRYLSTLYGVVFFSHQIGAFLGVWLGGRLYDTIGTYQPVWIISIVLGLLAAVVHLPISDSPIVHPAT